MRNWLVQPFRFEKFSVPAIGNGESCAASFGTGSPPSIRCLT